MSTNPYLHYFEGPAKRGFRSIRAGHEAAVGLAMIYAAIGASLGILSGTAVAMLFPISGHVATSNLAQASASVPGMGGALKTAIAQVPEVQRELGLQTAEMASGPQAQAGAELNDDRQVEARRTLVSTHKSFFSKELQAHQGIATGSHASTASDKALAPEKVSLKEVAMAEVPAAGFMVEGDATVADYDATTGLVETHEGKSFSIGTSASVSTAWDDYSGHVHYRCDKGGSCTLSRTGLVVPNVRMTT